METKGFKRRIGVDADDFIFQEEIIGNSKIVFLIVSLSMFMSNS